MNRMFNKKVVPLILLFILILLLVFFLPIKQAFTFTEHRTDHPKRFFLPLTNVDEFQIRYVHSIHLTDVVEAYEVMDGVKIRLLSMTYENLGIGLPGYAAEGETLALKDGMYALTYDDKVIEEFTLYIGSVDAELAFRYDGNEIDLKIFFDKGKSYIFCVTKLSFYQMLKGADLNVKRNKE